MAERTGYFKHVSRKVSDSPWYMIAPLQSCAEVISHMVRSDPQVP